MLRHGEDHTAARSCCLAKLQDHVLVLADVFENVERRHNVEFGLERNPTCVHLSEVGLRKSSARDVETRCGELAAEGFDVGKASHQSRKHETRAATYFEEVVSAWKVLPDRPGDQVVP